MSPPVAAARAAAPGKKSAAPSVAPRTYEFMFILDPTLDDAGSMEVVQRVEGIVTAQGGTVVSLKPWERRSLAYQINGFSEGLYILCYFDAPPDAIVRIETRVRLLEGVIRFLVLRVEGVPTEPPPKSKSAAEAEAGADESKSDEEAEAKPAAPDADAAPEKEADAEHPGETPPEPAEAAPGESGEEAKAESAAPPEDDKADGEAEPAEGEGK